MVKQPNAGSRNKKIEIQRINPDKPYIKDSIGNQIKNWETYYKPWAYIKNTNGNSFFVAQREGHKKTIKFNIRYRKDRIINDKMRVIYNGQIYSILYVDDIEEHHAQIEIMCEYVEG